MLAVQWAEAQSKGEQELLSVNSLKLLEKALLSLGLTATEQCHFPASKQEGTIVRSSQRECSAISPDYLAPEHFANKLQPGPKLPQCSLCHEVLLDHLCADISKSKL